jgi:hypothetical protein
MTVKLHFWCINVTLPSINDGKTTFWVHKHNSMSLAIVYLYFCIQKGIITII